MYLDRRIPIKDKKFLFLLSAIAIVIALEVLSIIGINIPMPYAPFIFAAFIFGIGYNVLWNGVKAIFKLQFSNCKNRLKLTRQPGPN